MVVADPAAELLGLVTAGGAVGEVAIEPSDAARRAAHLVRRRFGLALPPPFTAAPSAGDEERPIRRATAFDGAAIAAVKWRAFGVTYRGVLPDRFLDQREVVPPPAFWSGRAMVPPSPRYQLWVWGRPGEVFGYADTGPVHPDDASPDRPEAGELYELYVDPAAQGCGGGSRLLAEAEASLAASSAGWAELSVLDVNHRARAFYEARGWTDTGRVNHVDLGVVAFDERRYDRRLTS
jgi:ribosomal protein S18 acetylase RimI-like enzyme